MKDILLELLYVLAGLVAIFAGSYALKDESHKNKLGTAAFWYLFGAIFIFGKYIPSHIVGGLLLVMGVLTAFKKVGAGSQINSSEEYRTTQSNKIGNIIFVPALTIGVVAFSTAQFTSLGGLVGLGFHSWYHKRKSKIYFI